MNKLLRGWMVAVALCVGSAWAAEPVVKVGVVNTDRLFQQSAIAQKINKKLQDEFSKRDAELQKLRGKVRDLQSDLERNEATMAEADRSKKQGDLRALNTQLQRAEREFREDLNARQSEEMSALQERAIKAIRQLAEAEKFDLILQGQDLAYVSARIDVTDKIMKLMGDK